MTDRFLTISEAEKFTGKSRSTLRRFIDGIVKVEQAADRHLLLPTEADVRALRAQNQPFAWKISEELLRRQFLKPAETPAASGGEGSGEPGSSESSRLVAVLEKSILVLERELNEKNSQIAAMNERLRESNVLMKDLQSRLALPAGNSSAERPSQTVQDATTPVKAKAAPTKPTKPKPRRKSFSWFFGN